MAKTGNKENKSNMKDIIECLTYGCDAGEGGRKAFL
jgi:hypothetical protein